MDYLLFDGALNQTVIGLQLYIWLNLALFLICVGSYAIWFFFFWLPLKPVRGHFISHWNKTNSALTFDEHLNFVMRSEKKSKLIFDMPVKEAKTIQKFWKVSPSGLIGRVLCDLIFDGGKWLDMESPVRAEIERLAEIYNEGNHDDQIMTLGKFHQRAMEGKLGGLTQVNGVTYLNNTIPLTYIVPWKRIDFAIPSDHDPVQWDGYLGQLAQKKAAEQSGSTNTICYIILGGTILIAIGMVATKFLN